MGLIENHYSILIEITLGILASFVVYTLLISPVLDYTPPHEESITFANISVDFTRDGNYYHETVYLCDTAGERYTINAGITAELFYKDKVEYLNDHIEFNKTYLCIIGEDNYIYDYHIADDI